MAAGHCFKCENWKPNGKSRNRARIGNCAEYGEATTYDTFCNSRFRPLDSPTTTTEHDEIHT